jgi:hypothetical protein
MSRLVDLQTHKTAGESRELAKDIVDCCMRHKNAVVAAALAAVAGTLSADLRRNIIDYLRQVEAAHGNDDAKSEHD